MKILTFRCSQTGSSVQLRLSEPPLTNRADSYEAVASPAYDRLHPVNRTIGRTLSDKTRSDKQARGFLRPLLKALASLATRFDLFPGSCSG